MSFLNETARIWKILLLATRVYPQYTYVEKNFIDGTRWFP